MFIKCVIMVLKTGLKNEVKKKRQTQDKGETWKAPEAHKKKPLNELRYMFFRK